MTPTHTRVSRSLGVFAVLLQTAAVLIGQMQATPKGTAFILGQVVESDGHTPIADAMVNLRGIQPARTVLSDAQGRFLFRDLPKGTYVVAVNRAGYLSGASGRAIPGNDFPSFPLGDGEHLASLTIRMWKMAAIRGRLLDETGQPIVDATVRLLARKILGGRPMYSFETFQCGGACLVKRTDDRGAFAFANLAPGEYIVAVPYVSSSLPLSVQRQMQGPNGAMSTSYSPRLFESNVMMLGWLGGGAEGYGSLISAGDGRTGIHDVARGPLIASINERGDLSVYPTQYFPGVARVDDATSIKLGPGEERSNIDFALRPARTVTVSGMLTNPGGSPADYALRLIPAEQDALENDLEVAVTVTDVDGSFTFVGATPGNYIVRMQRRPLIPPKYAELPSAPTMTSIDGTARPTEPMEYAESRVSVGGANVTGVAVAVRTGLRVGGRIEFVGAATTPARSFGLVISPADGHRSVNLGHSLVYFDSKFEFLTQGQFPGWYILEPDPLIPGWFLRSATLNGRDVSEQPFDLVDSDVRDIVVTYADRPATTLSGAVVNREDGKAVPAAVVLVFPVTASAWVNNGRSPRRFAQITGDRSGAFTILNLPPGEYYILSVVDADVSQWQDPGTLRKLMPLATRTALSEGQSVSVRLSSIRWPR